MKRLLTIVLLAIAAIGAYADYSVNSITGNAYLLKHGESLKLKSGMALEPNDYLEIDKGATLVIFSSDDSKLYTINTSGMERVSRLIFQARRRAKSNSSSVNSQLSLKRNKDADGVVYIEKGKVTRALAVYDPEGEGVKMDGDKLAESVYAHLRDSLMVQHDNQDLVLTRRVEPDGLSFMIDNPLDHPVYFNVFKINGNDGSVTISELGQPVGCYAILPSQFLAREQGAGLDPAELHLIMVTDFYFDIDEVLTKLNSLLDAKSDVTAPELNLYLLPL